MTARGAGPDLSRRRRDSLGTTSSTRRSVGRSTVIVEGTPIAFSLSSRCSASTLGTGSPLKPMMTSRSRTPAFAAGPSGLDRECQDPARDREPAQPRGAPRDRDVLPADADVGASDTPVADQETSPRSARC